MSVQPGRGDGGERLAGRPSPEVLADIRTACERLFATEADFVRRFSSTLISLTPALRDLPEERALALADALGRAVLWAGLTDEPADVVAVTFENIGADHARQGFGADSYHGVGHALLRAARDSYTADWSSELSSGWVAFYGWLAPLLVSGAQRALEAQGRPPMAADPGPGGPPRPQQARHARNAEPTGPPPVPDPPVPPPFTGRDADPRKPDPRVGEGWAWAGPPPASYPTGSLPSLPVPEPPVRPGRPAGLAASRPADSGALSAAGLGSGSLTLDPRAVDPRGTDPRAVDPWGTDPRGIDPRGTDPWGTDPRGMDHRGMGRQRVDAHGAGPRGTGPMDTGPGGVGPLPTRPGPSDPLPPDPGRPGPGAFDPGRPGPGAFDPGAFPPAPHGASTLTTGPLRTAAPGADPFAGLPGPEGGQTGPGRRVSDAPHTLDDVLDVLHLGVLGSDERALDAVLTRVALRTGADLTAPRADQRADPGVVADVLLALDQMGYGVAPVLESVPRGGEDDVDDVDPSDARSRGWRRAIPLRYRS